MESCTFESPIGKFKITSEEGCITGLFMTEEEGAVAPACGVLSDACTQLEEYFAGKRKTFGLPLRLKGTRFQKKVWEQLRKIPYGETRSYSDIALASGSPKGARAVGQANNKNPVLILVPCHRVINKSGDLAGFACGTDVKKFLLNLEKNNSK